jgi:hypothetical protein
VKSKTNQDYYEIKEEDFYPPEDSRVYKSNVYDVNEDNNFRKYAEEYFQYCNEWGLYDEI